MQATRVAESGSAPIRFVSLIPFAPGSLRCGSACSKLGAIREELSGAVMSFQSEPGTIRWKMHFASPRSSVFDALSSDAGRAAFWAESAPETDGTITFNFLHHEPSSGRVLARQPPSIFKLEYFGSVVEFALEDDGSGGTDLTLVATGVDEAIRGEVIAGWVSVLMALKAAVDFGVDLRNHDASRTWGEGYADN